MMDGVQKREATPVQVSHYNDSLYTVEAGGQAGGGEASISQKGAKPHSPPNNLVSASEEEDSKTRVSTRFYRRSKSQLSHPSRQFPGFSPVKLVALISTVAVIYFLRIYLRRCLVPQLGTSSSSPSLSPSPFRIRGLLLPVVSNGSIAPRAVGSSHSRRLSQGEETPLDPICKSGETGDGGREGGSKADHNPQTGNQPGEERRRAKRAHAQTEAPEEEEDDVPKKNARPRAHRGQAQAEPGEEEKDRAADVPEHRPSHDVERAHLLKHEQLRTFETTFQQHLASLHSSSGKVIQETTADTVGTTCIKNSLSTIGRQAASIQK
uniref:Uncharacterized protein n=1 Tax=Toxoplasma gondii (strain ATCC 50861 / VEG) TaxID=432359 RepID=A0A0F7URE1_TOXGV|nr:TPA: hypothetical protein BN1205_034855 [Toxoplasma gondii VEG]